MNDTPTTTDGLPDFEKTFFTIQRWLNKHGRDPQAGLMLRDFMNDNCSCDFTDEEGKCELCGAKQ